MSEKHIVVQDATLKCKFSVEPKTDKLKILSHKKEFANDKDGAKKLIASDKDIGQTLEKNTFGKCKMQPNGSGDFMPCMAVITKWSDVYDNVTLENKGKILLENSKATCPIGGPDCISVDKHGQKTQGSSQSAKNANATVHKQINPLSTLKKEDKILEYKGVEATIQ